MKQNNHIKIGELAKLCGLTVRTLHYYEDIGLLVPGRSVKGHRLYGPDDVLRLQQILIQKSLGLPLEHIKAALDSPDFDYKAALQNQRKQLEQEIAQNNDQIRSIDAAIAKIEQKEAVMAISSLFDGFDPKSHDSEVKDRWGDTQAYQESSRGTASYTEQDWAEMKSELDQIWGDAAGYMNQGARPEGKDGALMAERHRAHIERWFYPCSPAMHAGLSDMWLSDERFRQNIDGFGKGLTEWISAAIKARA